MSLRSTTRALVNALDKGGVHSAPAISAALKDAGAVAGIHVGKKDMTPDEVVEWYAGQLVSILDNQNWFAVNSIINAVDKFCPEQP